MALKDLKPEASRRGSGEELSMQELERIFAQRAERLAAVPEGGVRAAGEEVFAFQAGAARFCVELKWVRNVIAPRNTALVSGAPAYMKEITHVDGRMVSMLRLDLCLNVTPASKQPENYILLEHNGKRILLAATALFGIQEADLSALGPAAQAAGSTVLKGVTNDMTLVLDGARVVTALRIDVAHEG